MISYLFIFAGLVTLAPPACGKLQLSASSDGSYYISVDGAKWLENSTSFFRVNGHVYNTSDMTLQHLKTATSNGTDSLGSFKLYGNMYSAAGRKVITGIRQYMDIPAIVFSQTFVDQFIGTSAGDAHNVVSGFPSFKTLQRSSPLGCLAFLGLMTGWTYLTTKPWSSSLPKLHDGLDSGPLVIFDQKDNVVVISPFNHFMSASFHHDPFQAAIHWGIMGEVDEIPANFKYETILFYSNEGINKAIEGWGRLMRGFYNRDQGARYLDPTVTSLGYYTDNGAYYYHAQEPGMNYEDTILAEVKYFQKAGIPYRYLQYDDWFYPIAGTGYKATVTWNASANVFPHGLAYLYNKTGLPVVAHNRYWSSKVTYAKQNGGLFNFIMDGENSIPDDQSFWDYLLSWGKTWGLVTYEQDWLSFQSEQLDVLRRSLTLASRWLTQMATAASRNGIYLQYCMGLPRDIMHALTTPSVTQARVSADYATNTNWKIGISSMFAEAMGIASFKDNFWSESIQPGNRYRKVEVNPAREACVALFSTGPVGPGDRIGYTNAKLIKSLATSDGTLLKPSKPAMAINAQILQMTFGGSLGPDGEVWTTFTEIGPFKFGFIFASELTKPFTIYPRHTSFGSAGMVFSSASYSPAQMLPRVFDENHGLSLDNCGNATLCLYYTSPVIYARGGNYILLGELDKMTHMSPIRVTGISASGLDLQVTLRGTPGEAFQFGLCRLGAEAGGCGAYNCIINDEGSALLSVATEMCG